MDNSRFGCGCVVTGFVIRLIVDPNIGEENVADFRSMYHAIHDGLVLYYQLNSYIIYYLTLSCKKSRVDSTLSWVASVAVHTMIHLPLTQRVKFTSLHKNPIYILSHTEFQLHMNIGRVLPLIWYNHATVHECCTLDMQ